MGIDKSKSLNFFLRVVSLVIVVELLFTLMRVILYCVCYKGFFDSLTVSNVLWSLLHGVRFDLAIMAVVFALPIIMMLCPLKLCLNNKWQSFWYWLFFALSCSLLLLLTGNCIYFIEVKRHVFNELFVMSNDMGFLLTAFLHSYLLLGLLVLCCFLGLFFLFKKIYRIRSYIRNPSLVFVIAIVLMFVCVRSSVGRKPIGVADAFVSADSKVGLLTLNGAFTVYKAFFGFGGGGQREI